MKQEEKRLVRNFIADRIGFAWIGVCIFCFWLLVLQGREHKM